MAARRRCPLWLVALAALVATAGAQQPLSMTLCFGDTKCSSLCTSWTTVAGACAVCTGGATACSPANPSSITTLSDITFFWDGACSPGARLNGSIPLVVDGSFACRRLSDAGGSYVATDLTGLIAGVTIGGIVFLALVITGIALCCCACARGSPGCCAGGGCGCCARERRGAVLTKAPPAVGPPPGPGATADAAPVGLTAPQPQAVAYA
jgi:hypothetical protein